MDRKEGRAGVYGVPFSVQSREALLEEVRGSIVRHESKVLTQADIGQVVQARNDRELRELYCRSDWVMCGSQMLWNLSRSYGLVVEQCVTAFDPIRDILRMADQHCFSIYILGGREDLNRRAIANIESEYPGIKKIGGFGPKWAPIDQMPHDDINTHIRSFRPDILMICLGSPKQEKWILRNLKRLDAGVVIGAGVCVELIAGMESGSTPWMDDSRMTRALRKVTHPIIQLGTRIRHALSMGRIVASERPSKGYYSGVTTPGSREQACLVRGGSETKNLSIHPCGHFQQFSGSGRDQIFSIIQSNSVETVTFDASELTGISSTGLGEILEVWRASEKGDHSFELIHAPDWLSGLLTRWGWTDFLTLRNEPLDGTGATPAFRSRSISSNSDQLNLTEEDGVEIPT